MNLRATRHDEPVSLAGRLADTGDKTIMLSNYDAARWFLAKARRVDEVKDFRDKGRRDGLLRTPFE